MYECLFHATEVNCLKVMFTFICLCISAASCFYYRIQNNSCSKSLDFSQALVAHTCNPSNSGSRDQEDLGLENNSWDPILKKPIIKKGLVEWLKA
jgi:hypothetical protein